MIVLPGLGLLAAVGVYWWSRRMERRLRRNAARLERLEERGARLYEDVCWRVYRQTEAELAMALWRCRNPFPALDAMSNMAAAFRAFSVPVKEASARLNALLASDPERRA